MWGEGGLGGNLQEKSRQQQHLHKDGDKTVAQQGGLTACSLGGIKAQQQAATFHQSTVARVYTNPQSLFEIDEKQVERILLQKSTATSA